MTPTQRVDVLYCPCGEQIVLPRQTPLGISGDRHYQPMNGWPLTYLCPYCGRLSEHSPHTVQRVGVEAMVPSPYSETLWSVEFECAHENCGTRHAIYTKQRVVASEDSVATTLFARMPTATCRSGKHELILPDRAKQAICLEY
jgi:hypothetical protein